MGPDRVKGCIMATERKTARCWPKTVTFQATRTEPAKKVFQVDVEVAPGTPCPIVACKGMDEARELAAKYGFDGLYIC